MQPYNPANGDAVVNPHFPANGIPGEVISVRTDMNNHVHAWRPTGPLPNNPQTCYFCHGYSLGTFGMGYSVLSGAGITRILADEYMKLGTLGIGNDPQMQKGDLLVWWKGNDAIHSALIDMAAMMPGPAPHRIDEALTRVSSKTGTSIVRIQVPLRTVMNDYRTANLIECYRKY